VGLKDWELELFHCEGNGVSACELRSGPGILSRNNLFLKIPEERISGLNVVVSHVVESGIRLLIEA